MNHEELKKLRALMRAYVSHVVTYQDAVARSLGLGANDMKCFRVLDSEGTMTPGQLARRTGITTGGITKILDRLEKRGAIVRKQVPTDRRAVIVKVTPPSRMIFGDTDIDFDRMTAQLFQDYDAEQLSTIKDFMQKSLGTISQFTEELDDTSDLSF